MEATDPEEKQPEHGELDLPGFRFHPTEEELLGFYLKKKVQGQKFSFDIIRTLDLYRYDPWQLPGMANHRGESEWFFFVPRGSKCPAPRRSRLTASGYWKVTGTERALRNQGLQRIGLKKTLVFYAGKAPRGQRSDWIMNEYRLPEPDCSSSFKEDVVLCRIYKKATPHKALEQRAIMACQQYPEKGGECSVEETLMPPLRLNSITESGVPRRNCGHGNGINSMDDGQSSVNTSAVEGQMEFAGRGASQVSCEELPGEYRKYQDTFHSVVQSKRLCL